MRVLHQGFVVLAVAAVLAFPAMAAMDETDSGSTISSSSDNSLDKGVPEAVAREAARRRSQAVVIKAPPPLPDPTKAKQPVVNVVKELPKRTPPPETQGTASSAAIASPTQPEAPVAKPSFLERVGGLFGKKKDESASTPALAAGKAPAAVSVQPAANETAAPGKAEARDAVKVEEIGTRRKGRKSAPAAGSGADAE